MSRARGREPRWPGRQRVALVVAIVGFVLLDAALVVLAFRAAGARDDSAGYVDPVRVPDVAQVTEEAEPPFVAPLVVRSLAATGDGVVWRAEAGACSESAVPRLTVSSDGGSTWIEQDIARYDIRRILSIAVRNEDYGEMVARVGDSCEFVGLRSFTAGRFWERADNVQSEHVFVDDTDASVIVVGGEPLPSPCAVTAHAAEVAESIVALCNDGALFWWGDGTWGPGMEADGAVALVGGAPDVELVRIGPAADCSLEVVRLGADGGFEPIACVGGQREQGAIAVRADDGLWVWSGETIVRY